MNYEKIAILWLFREYGPTSTQRLFQLIYENNDIWARIKKLPRLYHVLAHGVASYQTLLIDPVPFSIAATSVFYPIVRTLVESGMLQIHGDNVKDNNFTKETEVNISNMYDAYKDTFGISLTKTLFYEKPAMDTYPIWGEPIKQQTPNWAQVFVAMPFLEELRSVYTDYIYPIAEELKLTCKRGDDFFSTNSIMHEVWSAIYHSQICIVDCTQRNSNVFYELGIAHTLGRKTVLIANSIDDIPFDIRHLRTIIYEYSSIGMDLFKQQLKRTIQNELGLENQ